jgi:hypothetical protein
MVTKPKAISIIARTPNLLANPSLFFILPPDMVSLLKYFRFTGRKFSHPYGNLIIDASSGSDN